MFSKPVLALSLGVVLLTISASGQQPSPAQHFYDSIRNNDLTTLRLLVAEHGTEVSGEGGMTPIVVAALFGSDDAMRLLIENGADVTKPKADGLTALHAVWRSQAMVRLLLDHGAKVNARSDIGSTPLLVAAYANGTAPVVAELLARGADPNIAENRGVTPLIAAAGVGNSAAAKLLLEHGADPNAYAEGTGQKTATALMGAAHNGDLSLVRLLLARSVDVNRVSPDNDGIVKNGPVAFGRITALHVAVLSGSTEVTELLLKAGAKADAKDARNLTPLDWAVASDHPDPAMLRLLLRKGSAATPVVESARDWARKFNDPATLSAFHTRVVRLAATTSTLRTPTDLTVRQAIERSVPLLHTASNRVLTDGGCTACHAQPISAIAADLAYRHGIHVEPPATEQSQVVAGLNGGLGPLLQGRESGGLPDTHLYSTFMMAETHMAPTFGTDGFVGYLAGKQREAGNWHGIGTRAPIQDGDVSRTALAIRVLGAYAPPARRDEFSARIARAASWLAAQTPESTEQRVMQIMGLYWAKGDQARQQRRIQQLIALQRTDDGWAQTPHLESDAYATGQVLYALRSVGVVSTTPALTRGIDFLLRTQARDGSWFVKSRAMKIQPYFESGFPYGHDQWISQSGTAWAVMGLSLTMDDTAQRTAAR
jgi:ankyrin repeat protein